MNGTHGANKWAEKHNCKFAPEKFAFMGFSRRREADGGNRGKTRPRTRPNIEINGLAIEPVNHHKFLGMMIDEELRFTAHGNYEKENR